MNNPKLQREQQKIDGLFQSVDGFQGDLYIKAQLTLYLCIKVSGFIENCVRIIFEEYATLHSQDYAQNFILKKLEKFPNPRFENICGLTKDFNQKWSQDFKKSVARQQRDSLISINNHRNLIAHGQDSTITLVELRKFYQDIIIILEYLERTCV